MAILPHGMTEDVTYTGSGDLSASQYHIVKLSAAGVVAIAGAGEKCQGVLKNKPTDGRQASVVTDGEALVYVDATTAINVGDRIMAASGGVGVKVPATAATKSEFVGTALEAKASGTGTIVVDIEPGVITTPAT